MLPPMATRSPPWSTARATASIAASAKSTEPPTSACTARASVSTIVQSTVTCSCAPSGPSRNTTNGQMKAVVEGRATLMVNGVVSAGAALAPPGPPNPEGEPDELVLLPPEVGGWGGTVGAALLPAGA